MWGGVAATTTTTKTTKQPHGNDTDDSRQLILTILLLLRPTSVSTLPLLLVRSSINRPKPLLSAMIFTVFPPHPPPWSHRFQCHPMQCMPRPSSKSHAAVASLQQSSKSGRNLGYISEFHCKYSLLSSPRPPPQKKNNNDNKNRKEGRKKDDEHEGEEEEDRGNERTNERTSSPARQTDRRGGGILSLPFPSLPWEEYNY